MSFWFYRLATTLAPLVPERFGYWLFARFGDVAYIFGRRAREQYLKNLEHVLGADSAPAELERLARLAFRNLLKNYFDLFRGHRLTSDQVRAQLAQVIGFEHMESALAQGNGVIAGSAHYGNYNLFLHLSAIYLKERARIVVPVEHLRPEKLYQLVKEQRASQGIEIVPVESAARTLIKTVRAGNIAGLALDYDVTGTGQLIDFFGAPARLPDGAAALSLKYNAPVILGFSRRLDNNRCEIVIEPPLEMESTGDQARDTRVGTEQVARVLEKWIRRYPEQWLMLQPIWESDKHK